MFNRFYIEDPIKKTYKEIIHEFTGNNPKDGGTYEKMKDYLNVKNSVNMHNRIITITMIQVFVSIALVISTIGLIIVTLIGKQ